MEGRKEGLLLVFSSREDAGKRLEVGVVAFSAGEDGMEVLLTGVAFLSDGLLYGVRLALPFFVGVVGGML